MITFEEPTESNNNEFTMFKDGEKIDTYKVFGYWKEKKSFNIQMLNHFLFISKFLYEDFIITVIDDNGDFSEVECEIDPFESDDVITFKAKKYNYFILPEIRGEEEEIQELKEEIESLKEERNAFKKDADSYKEALELYRKEIISLKKELEEAKEENSEISSDNAELKMKIIRLKMLSRRELQNFRKSLELLLGD